MQLTDIFFVLHWWILLGFIGLIFFPIAISIFPTFFDKGYIFAKTLGFCLLTYTIFILGVIHLLPFSSIGSWVVLLLWAFFLFFDPIKRKVRLQTLSIIKQQRNIIFWEEMLFLIGLFFLAYIRSFNPDIHGLEKYMDFGFINSILRTRYFPPVDMWFPPFSINYYYFGHLVTAVLTKLSGISSNITFNLMLATVFSLTFASAFSIAANAIYVLHKHIINKVLIAGGLLSAFLVTLGGNLHIIYAFFSPYENESPVPPWTLVFQPDKFPNSYWYPNATRFIYHTIHEFPIYSWVVSDLHGHVLDIPVVLTTIAVLVSMFFKSQAQKSKQTSKKSNKNSYVITNWPFIKLCLSAGRSWQSKVENISYTDVSLLGFLVAAMYMTNAWDGIIYFLLAALVVFAMQIKNTISTSSSHTIKYYLSHTKQKNILPKTIYILLSIAILAVVFTLPYSLFFKPFASGIGILCAPSFLTKIGKIGPFLFEANHCQHSPWWQMLILYGFFAFFALSLLIFLRKFKQTLAVDWLFFLFILMGIILITLPEFIYLKDIYPEHYRANTMFKLVFQAFIMLSLMSGYVFVRFAGLFRRAISQKMQGTAIGLGIWVLIALFLIGLAALYPYLSISSYYGNLQVYKGLDGIKYLQSLYPDDYTAINWINTHIKGQPVMLEAQGDSYTDYERISTDTGLPTVLGWTVHEWLWRGTYDIPAPRITEVQTIYTSSDLAATKQLLQKYKVEYVYIGGLEKQKYPNLNEEKFKQLGKMVYQNATVKIYKLSV